MGCSTSKYHQAPNAGHKAAKKNKGKANHHHRRKQMIEDESQVATSLTWADRGSSIRESVVCDKPVESPTPVPPSSAVHPTKDGADPEKANTGDSSNVPQDLLTGDNVINEDSTVVPKDFASLENVAGDKWPGEV